MGKRWLLTGAVVLLLWSGLEAATLGLMVQAGVGLPPRVLQQLQTYAFQRCVAVTGCQVIPPYRVREAARSEGVFLGASVPQKGLERLLGRLGADYLLVLRVTRWEERWDFRAERALVLVGLGALDPTLGNLLGPVGLLVSLEREAEVTVLLRLFGKEGLLYSDVVTIHDAPIFSWFSATPLNAAEKALEISLLKLSQMLG
ncbi:MAG TPA: hypothetical protein ENF77_03565 [Candidatus Acetothermia bacterium]|nr:hypothetical protein [Candidatus Acetothermia bacterium]